MINTLYTLLSDLYTTNGGELEHIFDTTVSKASSNTNLGCLVNTESTGEAEAREKIAEALRVVRDGGVDLYTMISKLQHILTPEGLAKLYQVLVTKGKEAEIIEEEMMNPLEHMQSLFQGLPLFRIVVEDRLKANKKHYDKEGRYNVYMEKITTNERSQVLFATKEAKILFLWFLRHPRVEYSKAKILQHVQEILNIGWNAYPNYETLANKLKDGDIDKLTSVVTRSKTNANNFVSTVLGDRDREEWYTIEYDTKNLKYSLSLPEEYIVLPESLKI